MFEKTKAVMFALDGTIYHGSKLIDGAAEAVSHCRKLGKSVFFLTNNSSDTRSDIFHKLRNLGIECTFREVMTSGYVAALYAHREKLENIYVCGSKKLISEFEKLSVHTVDEENAQTLIIGLDKEFDYAKLNTATRIAKKVKTIIACNKERLYPGESAELEAGCGGIVSAIEWCSGRMVDYLIGKPNTLMLDIACEQIHIQHDEILVVGDTYDEDVLMANKFGCPSVLISNNIYADTLSIQSISELTNLLG